MKAYLGWPVSLSVYPQAKDLHVTAKYLGDVTALMHIIGPIRAALEELDTSLDLTKSCWVPELWEGPRPSIKNHVLLLNAVPQAAYDVADALRDLRKDEWPTWRPHISVPALAWVHVARMGIPLSAGLTSVGPLTLFVKNPGEDYKGIITL